MLSTVLLAACLGTQAVPNQVAIQLGDPTAHVQLDRQGLLRFAQGQLGFLPLKHEDIGMFLLDRREAMGLRVDEKLNVLGENLDGMGNRHLRVQRQIHGVPVEFDQVRLHAGPSGLVYAMESELSDLRAFKYQAPTVSPWRAIQIAEGGFKGKMHETSHAELVIVGESLEGVHGAHLAYRVHVAFPARPGKVPVVEDEYVDASSGAVLAHLSRVYTDGNPDTMSVQTLDGSTVSVNVDNISGQGILLKDIATPGQGGPTIYTLDNDNNGNIYNTTDTSTPFSDGAGQGGEPGSIASNVKITVDYFKNTFAWQSWDFSAAQGANPGGLVAGIAHEGQNLANAYFVTQTSNGQVFGTMHYGDGDGQNLTNTAKCLDVTGHEMGHGVVQGTANLTYHNQSGALNESYADVFGWILKNQNGQANSYIGDLCVGPSLQPALRDMCNPANVPLAQPATMSAYVNSPDTDDGDHGGVHTNSGITNHAACLFEQSAGFDTLGKIWFQALKNHLGATSSFQDMVNATMTSCGELGLDSGTCNSLASAWETVGLTAPASSGGGCPANATSSNGSCVCNTGFQPDASGNCTAVTQGNCPTNSTADASSGQCYCNDGYSPSSDGSACVADQTGGCGDHAHQEGGSCVCDTCYVFSSSQAGSETGSCQVDPSCNPSCNDPGSNNDANCDCVGGLSKDANGKCTVPAGGCGNETYAGRCVGNVLVYCYDVADGAPSDQVDVVDCSTDPYQNGDTGCGADTQNGGYNCVAPVSNCGSTPATGACGSNGSASYCSDGTIQTVDCSGSPCITYNYSGYTYTFCNPCPAGQIPAADGNPTASGDVNCVAGSATTTTTTSSSGGSSGSTGSGGDSSGCGSTGNSTSFLALVGAMALLVIRRKR